MAHKTVVSGIIAFVWLPNGVASAKFLTTEERDFASERLANDNGGRFKCVFPPVLALIYRDSS